MAKEEKLEELRQEYRDALREGRTEEATEAFNELRSLESGGKPEPDPEPEQEEELGGWESLKGVGPGLAESLREKFGELEDFDPEEDDLTEVSGVGSSKADNLLDQL